MTRLVLEWKPRPDPLAPLAALAEGDVTPRLRARLSRFGDEALTHVAGAQGDDWLCVIAERPRLPWVEGIQYLGRDPDASALLLPTTHRPNIPVALLQRILIHRFSQSLPPLALCIQSERVLALGCAVAIERGWLETEAR
ncbi:MAG: hypothetical protein KC609_04295 [Myxococcales bacterium]|nr:hypothetical protein [Myxococcales bacterium]